MAISLVQSKSGTGTPSSSGSYTLTITLSAATTIGNTIVVGGGGYGKNANGMSVKIGGSADHFTRGNTFERNFGSGNLDSTFSALSYDPNCLSSATIAVTFSGAAAFTPVAAFVWEVTGLGSSPVLDITDATGGGDSPYSTGSGVTSTNANEFWAYFTSCGGTPTGSSSPWSNFSAANDCIAGYQITTSTGTAHATGSYASPANPFSAVLIGLAPSGGPTTITDSDVFNTTNEQVVQQIMAATDNPVTPVADVAGQASFEDADTSHAAETRNAVVATTVDVDSPQSNAVDLPVSQRIITSDTSQLTVETPLPGPVDADSGHSAGEGTLVSATLTDAEDAIGGFAEVDGAASATLISADQYQTPVESATIVTNVKNDGDVAAFDDEPIVPTGTVADAEVSQSSFDVGARFPFTDTETIHGNDAVVAHGSVIVDGETAHGDDVGGFGTIFRDSDSNSAVEDIKLIIHDCETIASDEKSVPAPALLNASEVSHTAVETGFASFDGTSRVTTSCAVSWNVRKHTCTTTAISWRTLQRKTRTVLVNWGVIQRRVHSYSVRFDVLFRQVAQNASLSLQWNVFNPVTKTVALRWNTVSRVLGDHLHIEWNTLHRYTGQLSRFFAWNVGTIYPLRVVKSAMLAKWNTYQRKLKSALTEWNTNATPTRKSKTPVLIKWDTIARKVKTASLTEWNVAAPTTRVSKPVVSLAWNTTQHKTASAVVRWNTDARLSKNVASFSWRTLQRKSRTPVLAKWNTTQRQSITPTITWETRKRLAKPAVLAEWNTAGRTIGHLYRLQWNTIQRMSKTRTIDWSTMQRKIKTAMLTEWSIYNPVTKAVLVQWNTLQRHDAASTLGWKVYQRKNKACQMNWRVVQRIFCVPPQVLEDEAGQPISEQNGNWIDTTNGYGILIGWNALQRQHQTATTDWNVLPRVRTTCSLRWNTITRRHVTFYSINWETLNTIQVRATLEWNIGPQVQGLIRNAPAAPWQSAYPSR